MDFAGCNNCGGAGCLILRDGTDLDTDLPAQRLECLRCEKPYIDKVPELERRIEDARVFHEKSYLDMPTDLFIKILMKKITGEEADK